MPKTIHLRFYEELNDFLPEERKKTSFSLNIDGAAKLEDVLKGLGVPQERVDLICAGSRSVHFSYRPCDGERIAVYPVFEAMDISGMSALDGRPLRRPAFISDVHLGRLAKRLRLLGFDTLYRSDYTDEQIIYISLRESRVILTRDRRLLEDKRVTHGIWVSNENVDAQAREIMARMDLYNNIEPFSRCLECNGAIKEASRDDVIDKLPPKTKDYYEEFFQCEECGRVYWKGSHYKRMTRFIDNIRRQSSEMTND